MTTETNPIVEPIKDETQVKEDFVPKSHFEKVLTEKKNAMQALNDERAKVANLTAESLKAKDDWKTIAEIAQKESLEIKTQYEGLKIQRTNEVKLTAVKREFEKMGLSDSKTFDTIQGLINIDGLKYDEDHKLVLGVEEEAKRIRDAIPQLFGQSKPGAMHSAPKGAPADVSVDEYQRMIADGSWRKMSKVEQHAYTAKIYEKMGVTAKK